MKFLRMGLILLATGLFGWNAQAAIHTLDAYDSGCVVDGSTAGCFGYSAPTGTGFSGPVMTACVAKAGSNQRCRNCVDAYYDNGQPKGYMICGYTTLSAQCACNNANTPNCAGYGNCTYYPNQ